MEETLQEFHHLKIQLKDIKSATNDFNNKPIGGGGFGKVYEGELLLSKGPTKVAIKRLNTNPKHGQGKTEFLKEIKTLSKYKHENLINLLGFCYEEKKKDKETEVILVYEYASRQSLEKHLASPDLTWKRRLKICLDAAKGLSYLHDPRGTHERLIHRDMKSANILLDDDWNAKVSDFGLSIVGPANGKDSVVVVNTAGTYGYCDPQYASTQTLTKESDVYSFGVVLFEILCGKLCYVYIDDNNKKCFVPSWMRSYEQKKLNDIIFKHPDIQPLDVSALKDFSDIAFQCLNKSREKRPKMSDVVTRLEIALDNQEISEGKPLFDYEEMIKSAKPPLNYTSKGELNHLLTKGVLLNDGKTWFTLNKKGEHCEMISFEECLDSPPNHFFYKHELSGYKSRFVGGPYKYQKKNLRIKTHVKARFLSPGITYIVNFVFKNYKSDPKDLHEIIELKYKLPGETKPSISYHSDLREDGWSMCELYQFTADKKNFYLEILFEGFHGNSYSDLAVEGIYFQPLEKVEDKDEEQPISDSDANWEEKLPNDYEDIMKWSKDVLQWTTKKEAYSMIRKGFFIDDGQKWFFLDKNGKKCHMISSRVVISSASYKSKVMPLSESRFKEAFQTTTYRFTIKGEIQSHLVSCETTYACYLVYKFPKDQSRFEAPAQVDDRENLSLGDINIRCIYLVTPQTPVITPKVDQNTHNPVNRPKKKGFPQQRKDGWTEVQFWEFTTATTVETIPMHFNISPQSNVIIEGVELRPI